MNNNGTTIKSHRGIMYNVFSLLNTWKKVIKKQEEKKNTKFPTFYSFECNTKLTYDTILSENDMNISY